MISKSIKRLPTPRPLRSKKKFSPQSSQKLSLLLSPQSSQKLPRLISAEHESKKFIEEAEEEPEPELEC